MGFSLEFCVISISPLRLEEFSLSFGQMFISVKQCSEPMTQVRRLKVKVKIKGHGIKTLNFVSASYLLYSYRIFIELCSNADLSEMVCRTYVSTMQTQSQV